MSLHALLWFSHQLFRQRWWGRASALKAALKAGRRGGESIARGECYK
ncbi:hypothetical protein EcWSU1_A006 (plasmid) [Enterobacter ludwigii]|uniref:Uncharacterized protein n=1 Tax=Enterobacter ludwigii TaxID=299767 RepID=G8LQ84_9ENTR|nr:hypothetical protein EcWSU1_A006 [Enterobacter ludwigii]